MGFATTIRYANPVIASTTEASTSIQSLIQNAAVKYQIPALVISSVIRCESNFEPTIIGDDGASIGIVQIDLHYHGATSSDPLDPVTLAQALDPAFSIDFLAHEIKNGNAHEWTCYRNIYGDNLEFAL